MFFFLSSPFPFHFICVHIPFLSIKTEHPRGIQASLKTKRSRGWVASGRHRADMTEACPIDLLLVVLKWPFVLRSCLNGCNTEEATGVWLTLSALRGKRFFCCCSMGTALKMARDTGDSVGWLNVDRIAPRTPPSLHTPRPPKVSIEWVLNSQKCFLFSESEISLFGGQMESGREEDFFDPLFPKNSRMASFHTSWEPGFRVTDWLLYGWLPKKNLFY